jgi:rubrerythrin
MTVFGQPYSGLAKEGKLLDEELVKANRFIFAEANEATNLYMQLAKSTDNKVAVKVIKEIADEEKVHVEESLRLLRQLAHDEEEIFARGQ